MSEALKLGINRYTLYSLVKEGWIEKVSRGIYRLVELPPISNPDIVTVTLRVPEAVICLISALAFHQMTSQIPHQVFIAIPRRLRVPSLDYPPIEVHRFTDPVYNSGIEEHRIDGESVKVYSAEKTLADCFKFRNKIGMDIALEALKLYRERKKPNWDLVMQYARVCRVEKVIRPYIEAVS